MAVVVSLEYPNRHYGSASLSLMFVPPVSKDLTLVQYIVVIDRTSQLGKILALNAFAALGLGTGQCTKATVSVSAHIEH